jgi:cell division septation protein DedD
MLLFSGLFFTLGFVMGRSQYDGQVRAETNPPGTVANPIEAKSTTRGKRSNKAEVPAAGNSAPEPSTASDWEFYNSAKNDPVNDNVKPAGLAPVAKGAAAKSVNTAARRSNGSVAAGGYNLQVAALRKEADAMHLAKELQRKRFPAFVVSPQADKYYHVQVGPYADQKSADAAKKGLEGAGFKAIVKH